MRTSLEVGQRLKMGQAWEVARTGVGIGTMEVREGMDVGQGLKRDKGCKWDRGWKQDRG